MSDRKKANDDRADKKECMEMICQDLIKIYQENPEAALAAAVMMELWEDKDMLHFEFYEKKKKKVFEV